MDFCPGRFTPSQLHGHPGRCAWHVVPKPCFGLRSDPLGQKLHRLGPLGTGCFSRKSASQPTRCLRLAQRRVHHPHRRGQDVPIRGESLILWSNQIRVEGVRLLSCWVHMLSGLYLPRRVKGHQPSFIAVMATLWESEIAAVWSQKQRGVVTRKGNSLLQA